MSLKLRTCKLYNIKKDGITQSLLSTFLTCRQKTKLYLKGWEKGYASQPLCDGSIGHHILELAYRDQMRTKKSTNKKHVTRYCNLAEDQWIRENPRPSVKDLECLQNALAMNEAILPVYFDYYKRDLKKLKWKGLEDKFSVDFILPDGRKTKLRGKKDGEFKNKGLWLFETKFKAQINIGDLTDTLSFETQVMLYNYARYKKDGTVPDGVLYNIIRRPSIKIRKGESLLKFMKRLRTDVESRPDFYFMRIEVYIEEKSMREFEKDLIRMVTDFYNWYENDILNYKNTYSCLNKYGRCEYIPVCSSKDYSGLTKRKILFPELAEY